MLVADRYERIAGVPAGVWDEIVPRDFFFQRAFFDVMERSRVEAARYRYLVLREGESPLGIAVLSAFTLKLDLLAGDPWVSRLRQWLPTLLDVPMVCCGVPASFGQHHVHVVDAGGRREALSCVHQEMETWAETLASGLLVWKEWSPDQGLAEAATEEGYVVLPTLPDHVIDPLPSSAESFLASLRSPYRRKFRSASRLMKGAGPSWTDAGLRLELRPFRNADVGEFHQGYSKVIARADARLETYPPAFFEELASSGLGVFTLRIVAETSRDSIVALLVPGGESLTFVLVAKEKAHYEDALYRLLLQCIVLYAIKSGYRALRLGQTSSYAKCSVGAEPRRLEAFLKMRSPLKHEALRLLGPRLFPEAELPRLRVYKSSAAMDASGTTCAPARRFA